MGNSAIQLVLFLALTTVALGQVKQTSLPRSSQFDETQEELRMLDISILNARMMPEMPHGKLAADLNAVLADDYVRIGRDGEVVVKQEEIENTQFRSFPESSKKKVEDLRVRIYGETAVVTSLVIRQVKEGNRAEVTERDRVTNVYIRRLGRWQLVNSQWTPIYTP